MGLTSLPVLNKIGYSNYWSNSWVSVKHNYYLLSTSTFLDSVHNYLTTDISFYKYLNTPSPLNKKNKIVLGDVWFFKYSGFILVSPMFFNSNILNEKKIKLRLDSYFFLPLFLKLESRF